MHIRRYQSGEESQIWDVYYSSTHVVVAREYTAAQVRRWAPDEYDAVEWANRLRRTNPFVAVVDRLVAGFAELLPGGWIDYFYCHANRQRQGTGSALMEAVEREAQLAGVARLSADVSTTAIEFFLAKGFQVVSERNNVICDAPARQYTVRKHLSRSTSSQPAPDLKT